MDIFYQEKLTEKPFVLDPVESAHCIKVLRKRKGDTIQLVDGAGGLFTAEILDENTKACRFSIVSHTPDYEPLGYNLDIAIAPTKNIDRFEWFIEKATEIGVSSITPLLCQRSERKHLRLDRLEKVIIAAMKQSKKAYKPALNDLLSIDKFLQQSHRGKKYMAHCMDGKKSAVWELGAQGAYTLMIGPEGDFTDEEIRLALSNGFEGLTLGDYRLRTETAGVVACSAIYFVHRQ